MNQRSFRLVFDSRRGMCVPAAEHTRHAGKAGSGATSRSTVIAAAGSLMLAGAAQAAAPIPPAATLNPPNALPVRSTAAARNAGDSGSFTVSSPAANRLLVNQVSGKAIVNWDSFNVGAGNTVQFVQPDKGSVLNRIWDANPSVVAGSIQANAEVILQNTNGVIFAPTARVETGRFVATALQVAQEAFLRGIRGTTDGSPSFGGDDTMRGGFVSIERGAEVRTAAGGDVLIFAPRVVNEGRIETPAGQTVLGAGQTVYLAASVDPAQRGLIVGIKPFNGDPDLNTVTQAEAAGYKTVNGQTVPDGTPDNTAGLVSKVNAIVAESGSINLVGLVVRQNGLLRATTAVKGQNGVIMLQAQADVNPLAEQAVAGQYVNVPQTTALGTVTLGPTSVTQVMPSNDRTATQFDAETFNPSRVRVEGQSILVRGGAQVVAPAGKIELLASNKPDQSVVFDPGSFNLSSHARDDSRIVIETGATLSVAGLRDVELPMSRNQLSGRLFQIELADSPVQRDGALYRETIYFDARNAPTIADVSGFYSTIARSAEELSTRGGTINLQSDGGVAVDRSVNLDVSGGSVRYTDGQIRTSLLRHGASWVPLNQASKAVRYDELGNSAARTDAGKAVFKIDAVKGYVQGADAGSLTVAGRRSYFDGAVAAGAVVGPRQTGRGPDTPPRAGEIVFGRVRITDSSQSALTVAAGSAAERPDGLFADPLHAAVDSTLAPTLTLSAVALNAFGAGSLKAYVTDRFELAGGAALALANRGNLLVEAGAIQINGRVSAAGGSIALSTFGSVDTTHDITLGAAASLDTSGSLVVDSRLATSSPQVALDGGSVTLSAAGGLAAAPGAVIDVSAGALRSGNGSLRTGVAGKSQLALNRDADVTRALPGSFDDWHAMLAGYDFGKGGSLAVSGLPVLTLDGSDAGPFTARFFSGNGFGSISLSTLGDITVTDGLRLDLKLANYLPASGVGEGLVAVGVQPVDSLRSPISLSLQGTTASNALLAIRGSSLVMQRGSRIATEPGGSLRLGARRDLTMGGELIAPGGSIELAIRGDRGGNLNSGVYDDTLGFLADQALWLTSDARLSVAGTSELKPDRSGRPTGTLYGGGTIALTAQRGYLVAEAGAELDLRGASATLLTEASALPLKASRNGGALSIATPEGLRFDATVRALAADADADAGTLSVVLSLNDRERLTSGIAYPTAPRELRLIDGAPAPAAGRPGQDVQAWLGNGTGTLSNALIRQAGFSRVALKADDRIVFEGTQQVSTSRSIVLDSPVLASSPGIEATVRAPYVAIGDQRRTQRLSFEAPPEASTGDAVLDIRAGLIEVHGDTALQGFRFAGLNATLDSAGGNTRQNGEVRLVGTARGLANRPSGSLGFTDELQVTAGQLYTTTLSTFSITGRGGQSSFGSYQPAGLSLSDAPLSALGVLSLDADRVDVRGVIRQPFGSIAIRANELNIFGGSELSVAGTGSTIPLGTTVNGRTWQYRPDGLYQSGGDAKPVDPSINPDILALESLPVAKGLSLDGARLSIDAGARLAAAGGGRLQAWEFVAGVGGSTDTLTRPGYYAVLPTQRFEFAPSDAEVLASAGSNAPGPGALLRITMAGSALAPGVYTLLPARYALLPGAVRVSVTTGKAPLLKPQSNDDGSVVVTGSLTALGSTSNDLQRILVEPATAVLARSRLDRNDVGALLTDAAQRLGTARPALPSDAGRVVIASPQPFDLGATVDLRGVGGARGGSLDIAVAGGKLAIVDDIVSPPAGVDGAWSRLSAAALSASGAGSLLIGGVRGADGLAIDARSSSVSMLATQHRLSAGDVMLVARDDLALGDGSSVSATGVPVPGARRLSLTGDSAFLLVSDATQTEVERRYESSVTQGQTGRLTVGGGAVLAGPTVQFDGSQTIALSPDASVSTDHLALATRRIAIGAPAVASSETTVIDGKLLASLAATPEVSLSSSTTIDFVGSRDLSFRALTLDAPNLRGVGNADALVRLRAQALTLRNTSGNNADAALTGGGALELLAAGTSAQGAPGSLVLGDAAAAQSSDGSGVRSQLLGFERTLLSSTGDLRFAGEGRVTAQGEATLRAVRVVAASGANQAFDAAGGSLRIDAVAAPPGTEAPVGQGAAIRLSGRTVEQFGRIELPAGRLEITASGSEGQPSVTLGEGSLTSAAGFAAAASPDWIVYGDAGKVSVSAGRGSIVVAGQIDVSAPGGARGGTVELSATGNAADTSVARVEFAGTAKLSGSGVGGAPGGRLDIDAGQLRVNGGQDGDLDALAARLAGAGFTSGLDVRVRRGDLALTAGTLGARRVSLSADSGSIAIGGRIDAAANAGGSVRITAGADARLDGSIVATSARPGGNGGDVLIAARDGRVTLGANARIDAGGDDAQDGRVVLRAGRDDVAGTVRVAIDKGFDSASQVRAGEIDLEAVRVYAGYTSLGTGATSGLRLGQGSLLADNQDFADRSGGVLAGLGLATDARASMRSGVEIRASGDFTVANDWNLWQPDRPGGAPGFLTIRAAGNLRVAGSISDGFESANRPTGSALTVPTEIEDGAAWSMRLVAGADIDPAKPAANPLATVNGANADLSIAQNKLVRTTAGSIDLAASRDIVLAPTSATATQGVVYVAGRPTGDTLALQGEGWSAQFTSHGGNLGVEAGRDIVGAPATQLFGAWFYHTGTIDSTPVAWWSAFDAFRQGLGSFGGGNVAVDAGRNIANLGVVAPSSGLASTAVSSDPSVTAVAPVVGNGGDIEIRAGNDILGGSYFIGRGQGLLEAARRIDEGPAIGAAKVAGVAPVLGLMEGGWTLRARGDLAWAAVYNPTMLPSANALAAGSQRIDDRDAGLFFTYAPDSSLSVASTAGRVRWQGEQPLGQPTMSSYWSALALSGPTAERIAWNSQYQDPTAWAPPIVQVSALGGPLTVTLPSPSSGVTLFPSPAGQLALYSHGDLQLVSNQNTLALALSDQTPALLPSVTAPILATPNNDDFTPTTFDTVTTAALVVRGGLDRSGTPPVRLAAGGSIDLSQGSRAAQVVLVFPKAAEISAGGDILNLSYIGQNNSARDVTSIVAGGSFVEGLGAASNRITLGGPGELAIRAGRQLDLGDSQGVETVGNLYAPALPSNGAAITLAAGQAGTLDVATFVSRYLTAGSSTRSPNELASALADSYFVATGKDPAKLGIDDQALRSTLVQRYVSYLALTGADSSGVPQRQGAWVALVRDSLGLPALPAAEQAAAFDPTLQAFKELPSAVQAAIAERFLTQLFAQAYLKDGQPYASRWQAANEAAGTSAADFSGPVFERVRNQVLIDELALVGGWASVVPGSATSTRQEIYAMGFSAADLAGKGNSQSFYGDLNMVASGVQARNGGDITLLAPGGQINVGLPGTGGGSVGGLRGVVTYGQGNISAFSEGDFQVNSQRVFVVGQGDINIWSSQGNIDAGRGANTAITIPALVPARQADGTIAFTLPSITVGSGIGILQPASGQAAGNIGLYAPNGEVLALDAQIRAPGRITLAAQVVRGADNITGGSVAGAPAAVQVSSPALPTNSSAAAESQGAMAGATQSAAGAASERERSSLLLVELLGLGAADDRETEDPTATEPTAEECAAAVPGSASAKACKRRVRPGSQ